MPGINPGTRDLAAWWELNEESGNRSDSHGANTLTDNNTVLFQAGKVGNAADFEDTTEESLSVADNAALSMGDIDVAFVTWIKMETDKTHYIFSKYVVGGDEREYYLRYNTTTNVFEFVCSSNGQAGGLTTCPATDFGEPSTGVFYFIMVRHDATANTVEVSVNDGTKTSTAHSGGIHPGTSPFFMGAHNGTGAPANWWDGLIDETAIIKRKLSNGEVTWFYNDGNGRAYSELSDFLPQVMIY